MAEYGSDHQLVLMKVRLCSRVHVRKVKERSNLRNKMLATKIGKMKYQMKLRLKLFEAKWINGSEVEKMWKELKDDVMETAEVVYGRKKN